jgi:hypothetical protein
MQLLKVSIPKSWVKENRQRWTYTPLHGSASLYAVPSQSSARYSLDKKLYTGRRPFDQHANDIQVMLDVLSGQRPGRPHNSQCFDELGDAVWGVVTLAWNQDPLARPKMNVVHALLLGMVMPNDISSFDTDSPARQAPRDSTDGAVPLHDDARPSTSERALAPAAPGVVSRLSGEENTPAAPAGAGAATATVTIDWNSDSTLSRRPPSFAETSTMISVRQVQATGETRQAAPALQLQHGTYHFLRMVCGVF